MYDGTWHAMQAGAVTGITRSIASDGTNVYIGSDACRHRGYRAGRPRRRWNGSAWHALGANAANTDGWFPASTFINGVAAIDRHVYVTGSFQNADDSTTADQVAQFNGANWAPMGSDGAANGPLPGPGNALALFGSRAIVGGNFTTAGGDPLAGYIAGYRVSTCRRRRRSPSPTDSTARTPPSPTRWRPTPTARSPPIAGAGATARRTRSTSSHPINTPPPAYTITLTVTDNDGAQSSSTASVTVRTGPIVSFTFSPTAPMVGQNVTFQSLSIDPDGTIVTTAGSTPHWRQVPICRS